MLDTVHVAHVIYSRFGKELRIFLNRSGTHCEVSSFILLICARYTVCSVHCSVHISPRKWQLFISIILILLLNEDILVLKALSTAVCSLCCLHSVINVIVELLGCGLELCLLQLLLFNDLLLLLRNAHQL